MHASFFWHAVPNGAIVVHPIADFSEHLVDALMLDNGYLMRQNLKFKCVNGLVAIHYTCIHICIYVGSAR